VAASLGEDCPFEGPQAFMVVEIGGGTTDIDVRSGGNVVQAARSSVAGQRHGTKPSCAK